MIPSTCLRMLSIVVGVSLTAGLTHAQTGANTGLQGRVTDPSGAAMPGVSVSLVRVETGERRTAETNETGDWEARFLTPGSYQLSFERTGFKKLIRDGVSVTTLEMGTVNVELPVGERPARPFRSERRPADRTRRSAMAERDAAGVDESIRRPVSRDRGARVDFPMTDGIASSALASRSIATANRCGRSTAARGARFQAASAVRRTPFTFSMRRAKRSGASAPGCSSGRTASMSTGTATCGWPTRGLRPRRI